MCKWPSYSSKGGISEDAETEGHLWLDTINGSNRGHGQLNCQPITWSRLWCGHQSCRLNSPDSQNLHSRTAYHILSFPLTAELLAEGQPDVHRVSLFFQPVSHRTDFHCIVRDVQHRTLKPRQHPADCKTSLLILFPPHNSQQQNTAVL